MKYRALDPAGDYQFGATGAFLVNTPAAVAQAVKTRLLLMTGEWFLDLEEGTPYATDILGYGTQSTRDVALKERIIGTPGVTQILDYASSVDAARKMTVTCLLSTQYGDTTVSIGL